VPREVTSTGLRGLPNGSQEEAILYQSNSVAHVPNLENVMAMTTVMAMTNCSEYPTSKYPDPTAVIDMRYENPHYMVEDASAADLIAEGSIADHPKPTRRCIQCACHGGNSDCGRSSSQLALSNKRADKDWDRYSGRRRFGDSLARFDTGGFSRKRSEKSRVFGPCFLCAQGRSAIGVVSTVGSKWIKQHLRIKAFYGTSENAVKTQIWIAVSIYVLVAIVRKRLGLPASLYQTLQILSVTLFEKTPILCALQAPDADAEFTENVNQLILFDI
jgi:hypothetical protein